MHFICVLMILFSFSSHAWLRVHRCPSHVSSLRPCRGISSTAMTCSASDGSGFVTVPSGLIAVYKPKEWSSSDVVGKVRNILRNGAKKAANKRAGKVNIKVGHGGTLDPLAEGVLVLGIGEGTKLLQQYLTGPKSYHAVGLLGSETDTLDSTGTVTSTAEWDHISHTTIDEALGMFRGEIMQVPPMYSALKRDGKRLYELARKGKEVEREPRPITIYSLAVCPAPAGGYCYPPGGYNYPQPAPAPTPQHTETTTAGDGSSNDHAGNADADADADAAGAGAGGLPYFALEVSCSGGTYIRTLIADIARSVDSRAHMTSLVRTRQGPFTLSDCLHQQQQQGAPQEEKGGVDYEPKYPQSGGEDNPQLEGTGGGGWTFQSLCEAIVRQSEEKDELPSSAELKHALRLEVEVE